MVHLMFYLWAISLFNVSNAWCPTQFIPIGDQCYFFSHTPETWEGALGLCDGVGELFDKHVSLAVMDFGLDPEKQNKLLLSKILENNGNYWLGGLAQEGTRNFTWVDGRVINPTYSYWYDTQPTASETQNCVSVQIQHSGSTSRSSLYSTNCSVKLKVICQTTPTDVQPKPECPSPFEEVGGYCMVFSKYLGTLQMTFEQARDYCHAIAVPKGTVDLAVLSLEGEHDQDVLSKILETGESNTWLGASTETGNSSTYWVDGREVDPTAYYWRRGQDPNNSVNNNYAIQAYHEYNHIKILLNSRTGKHHFVCQIF